MANILAGNKIYIDSIGSLTSQRTIVVGVLITTDSAGDTISLKDGEEGPTVMRLAGGETKQTYHFDFSRSPLIFANGIYVDDISEGMSATVITTQSSKR